MSIYGGMFSGVSALNAQATAFGILSDNITNVNTVGYKGSTAKFGTLVSSSGDTDTYQPGGVVSKPFTNPEKQGLMQSTGSPTDLAILGGGFFVVNSSAKPTGETPFALTRAGSFVADSNGDLRNTAGYYLQGYALDADGNIANEAIKGLTASLTTVSLGGLASQAQATTSLDIAANLPATTEAGTQLSTNVAIYDRLGVEHRLAVNWTKGVNLNEWSATFDLTPNAVLTNADWADVDINGDNNTVFGGFVNGVADGDPSGWDVTTGSFRNILGEGVTVTFTDSGALASVQGSTDGVLAGDPIIGVGDEGELTFDFPGFGSDAALFDLQTVDGNGDPVADIFQTGAGLSAITMNFGRVNETNGLSQIADGYNVSKINQNGSGPSSRAGVQVTDGGIVTAIFANGESKAIYKLAIGSVPSPTELGSLNGNAYLVSSSSGDLVLNQSGEGGLGTVQSGALESSTVDISEEFTDLIITQRAYSAATKILTTGDEMLDEIIRVKR